MKCPLFMLIAHRNSEYVKTGGADCLKEECAGWDDSNSCCCIVDIASSLSMVMYFLKDIAENGIPRRGG